jgi:hypothetical protein
MKTVSNSIGSAGSVVTGEQIPGRIAQVVRLKAQERTVGTESAVWRNAPFRMLD